MRAVQRPPSSNVVCEWVFALWILSSIAQVPLSLSAMFAPRMKRLPLWTLALVFYQGTQCGGNTPPCWLSGALQDSRSHLSSCFFSWWDVFTGHHSCETGTSLMFMAAVCLGRCIVLIPLTPFCVCHQLIKHVTTMFGDKSQNGHKTVHYCDRQVVIRTSFLHGRFYIPGACSLKMLLLNLQ